MTALPWFRFYPSDWRADPSLQACSIAARGLWCEMLLLMHEGTPRGHLCLPNGVMIDTQMLARFCHVQASECRKLIAELRKAEVFSVTENGVIYSRKMVRDNAKSQQASAAGKQGGNPRLKDKNEPLREAASLSGRLSGVLKPHWPLASPRKVSTSQGKALGQEEALEDEGNPFGEDAA